MYIIEPWPTPNVIYCTGPTRMTLQNLTSSIPVPDFPLDEAIASWSGAYLISEVLTLHMRLLCFCWCAVKMFKFQ